jgi:hypothetical protein
MEGNLLDAMTLKVRLRRHLFGKQRWHRRTGGNLVKRAGPRLASLLATFPHHAGQARHEHKHTHTARRVESSGTTK